MDESQVSARPSRIPLPQSRLPRAIRPSPSNDTIRTPTNGIPVSRMRAVPSKDQLLVHSTIAPSKGTSRQTAPSKVTVISKPTQGQLRSGPNNDVLFKKPAAVRRQDLQPAQIKTTVETSHREDAALKQGSTRRKPRPSLSERVLETLSQLPPSPAIRKRRDSSFFNPESPMRPQSRAETAGSRPASGDQTEPSMRPPSGDSWQESTIDNMGLPAALENTFISVQPISTKTETPSKLPSSLKTLKTPQSVTDLQVNTPTSKTSLPADVASPNITKTRRAATTKSNSRSVVTPRTPRLQAPIGGLVNKHMLETDPNSETLQKGSALKELSSPNPNASSPKTDAARKSSLALREQIAKAKAAKKAQGSGQVSSSLVPASKDDNAVSVVNSFDSGLPNDPFNLLTDRGEISQLLRMRINSARTDGRLNIAAMGLKEIPPEVFKMYDSDTMNGSWSECVDLTRLLAADNELESLDEVFPDIDFRHLSSNEDNEPKGNQFGGLETLDLHGNLLTKAPLGLRRLELLTTLNLSKNKLENNCLDVVCQIPSLKVLSIADNGLQGDLTPNIRNLNHLEVLDLHNNLLTSLPNGIIDLVRLKILDMSKNRLTVLPIEAMKLPLIQLLIANNSLTGVFTLSDDIEMASLQILDVSQNSLVSLADGVLALPHLQQLNCSVNRLIKLPDMTSWKSLLTVTAQDNKITDIPDGFTTLDKLKTADFSGNDLTIFDNRIGCMENLDHLNISGNPLKEKKFAAMTTQDLKKVLKSRIVRDEDEHPRIAEDEPSDTEYHSVPSTPSRASSLGWPIKAGGVLDRSRTSSYALPAVAIARLVTNNTVRAVELHHNIFQEIPISLALFSQTLTILNLAHNELSGESFLNEDIGLEVLKELNLSSNAIGSVEPLVQYFKAPILEKLDISVNRLTSLPPLRPHFPSLAVVLVSNNALTELPVESVSGLRVLDCSNNELGSLDVRIGLLDGPGGLEKFEISGNRFRVPNYTVLEKGTKATLAWLKNRIPAAESKAEDIN